MPRPSLSWFLAAALLLVGCPFFKKHPERDYSRPDAYDDLSPRKSAANALDVFLQAKDTSNAKLLGLTYARSGEGVTLGDSIERLELRCRDLMAYDSAKTPDFGALKGHKDLLFRVQEPDAGGAPVSRSLVFTRKLAQGDTTGKPEHWRPLLVGASYYLQKIDSALGRLPEESRKRALLLESPELEKVLLGFESQGKQLVIPIRLAQKPDSCGALLAESGMPMPQALAMLSRCYAGKDSLCDPMSRFRSRPKK